MLEKKLKRAYKDTENHKSFRLFRGELNWFTRVVIWKAPDAIKFPFWISEINTIAKNWLSID